MNNKRPFFSLSLLTFFAVSLLIGTVNAQLSVIINKESSYKPTKQDIQNIFSAAKLTWEDGSKIQVIDQKNMAISNRFYKKLIKKSAMQIRMQWLKLVFSGQAIAPIKSSNDQAVLKSIANTPNSIGYINSNAIDDTVQEVLKIE